VTGRDLGWVSFILILKQKRTKKKELFQLKEAYYMRIKQTVGRG